MKGENPYSRLKRIAGDLLGAIYRANTIECARIPDTTQAHSMNAGYLRERVIAANDLGYQVQLEVEGNSLVFVYVQDLPSLTGTPWEVIEAEVAASQSVARKPALAGVFNKREQS